MGLTLITKSRVKSELGLCPLPQHLGGCGSKGNEKQTRDLRGGGELR